MSDKIIASLEGTRVVPLVQSDDPKTALKISEALLEGGLDVLEVVLRTDAALDCLEAIAKEFPNALIRRQLKWPMMLAYPFCQALRPLQNYSKLGTLVFVP